MHSDGTLISARTNCMKKRETSNDVKTGPVARPVFLLRLLHKWTSYLDLTRKRLSPIGRLFGDCSKWNERPMSDARAEAPCPRTPRRFGRGDERLSGRYPAQTVDICIELMYKLIYEFLSDYAADRFSVSCTGL
jgi:hypothetical protein